MFKTVMTESVSEQELSLETFLEEVSCYTCLDEALYYSDNSYFQFYLENEDIISRNLVETEQPGYTGWSPSNKLAIKTIKYKGHILALEFDPELGTWQPTVRFRSVVNALKYGKTVIDNI